MPHCIIEFSETLTTKFSPEELLNEVYLGAVASQLFMADDIKCRLIPFQYFQSGLSKQNFIHVEVKILSGRTTTQRKALSNSVLDHLSQLTQQTNLLTSSISLTVEVVEIEKSSYSKMVN